MSPPRDDTDGLVLGREEAWVAHAALLAACERSVDADPDAVAAIETDATRIDPAETPPHGVPLRSIERDEPLDAEETALLREALIDYLGDAPVRDRAAGRALLRRTATAVGSTSNGV
ncbi:hypothetical protein J2751_000848 [Halorubrum alkaliphilum]|uniref:Uncharacterized protein n=1 Tax=Halorubrum alkaliphilum TaxID=261290 RepID=A0A8T4GEG0_9EURY|nr:hypothetical protein [Halorubrum alkaliphilum]MBP1921851.1 hypothetical protein [Halorubrum alkaliphilum]